MPPVSRIFRASAACLALLLALASPLPAHAQELEPQPTANGPDWAFGSATGDIVLTVASALSLAALALPQHQSAWAPSSELPDNATYGRISDFTGAFIGTTINLAGGYGLEAGYYAQNGVSSPYTRALRTSLIELQAVLLTTGISSAVKRFSGRCRPRAYDDGTCVGEEYDGFPSGHVAPVAAIAGVRLVNALRSEGITTQRWISFGLSEASSIATGVFRVLAGAHSWEDVLGGWAIGHATGALLALAHPMVPLGSRDSASPSPDTSVLHLPGREFHGARPTELPIGAPGVSEIPGLGTGLTIGWSFHF